MLAWITPFHLQITPCLPLPRKRSPDGASTISRSELYLRTIFTHAKLTAIMAWNTEEFRAYYNAMLRVNIKIMTSQQRWYLLVSYFNSKINFLFSCEIRPWSLRFCQFDIMSSKYSTKQCISAQYCAKQLSEIWCKIFKHFWDIAIFVLGYFILCHPVYSDNYLFYTF